MSLEVKIKEFIEKNIRKQVEVEENIFKSGIVNSLFTMQLIMFLEETFNITVENEEMNIENFSSVLAITNYVNNKLIATI